MFSGSTAAYDATRAERFERWLLAESFPPSYTDAVASVGETELLAATELFRAQYHEYYPNRAPLLLTPLNECRTRKMICTFIKPTVFVFEEMFDLAACARYFAGYMRYEVLEDMEELPEVVVSPATALQWQVGNCFELSLLLASALAGAGYNVYVVVGYARRFVCENDQTRRMWTDSEGLFDEVASDDEQEVEPDLDAEYTQLVKDRPPLRGVHDPEPTAPQQHQKQAKEQAANPAVLGAAVAEDAGGVRAAGPQTLDEGEKANEEKRQAPQRLLHSWLLVLPGGRKSQREVVFVEPSTGELIPHSAADTFYKGIEAVFNRRNYHVNLAPNVPVSALTLDLADGTQWEGMLFDPDAEEEQETSLQATGKRFNHNTTTGVRWWTCSGGDTSFPNLTATTMAVGGTISSGATSGCLLAAGTMNVFAHTLRDKVSRHGFSSWVQDLTLSREQYERRYPGGMKLVRYANAEVRWFAPHAMPDHRVTELWLPDTTYPHQKQVHTLFKHRADKLRRRSIYPLKDDGYESNLSRDNDAKEAGGVHYRNLNPRAGEPEPYRLLKEWYDRGRMRDASVEGLRLFTHGPGVERTMTFYWDARDDGLWRRQELFYEGCMLRKVKEFYRQRDDRLWYRSASFERSGGVQRMSRNRSSVFSERQVDETQRVEPLRVSEKYHRNEALPPDEDVAKYTFVRFVNGSGGEMWVYFHYRPGSIIRPYRMYTKAARGEEYLASTVAGSFPAALPCTIVLMPNAVEPSELEQYNERKRLAWWESVCLGKVRGMMTECNGILAALREAREPEVRGVLSVFDTLRNRPHETEADRARKLAEEASREASRKDYLAPYIAKLELPGSFDGDYLNVTLTLDQARQVRGEALRELKERLIQRGHIMKSQMDAEKKEFNEQQAAYQNKLDAAGLDAGRDEEEFAKYCKEATWRVKALDERLSKHIDQSSEKYAKLAQRLAEDPRLAALYKGQQQLPPPSS
ncbi:coiled-coil domain-containing protein 135 [Trypanosoma rangeli]|uniref:Coiled-coil domain-containing protein 135 n=1 Tax=Trypanosoma rangeli TaxID=5698 RepID=A0A3R7LNV4_TRYRA|nr:coiled-coil domain-containing protein 135 [Trypanosoma rangeli]RNF00545.1 coiled-coil domain-containing protein 135 [Trypanosoma rangeli]|eukprot:RNF00545.1 coiled-coil domain-containing protein 135 [Trypanosoma rangeli]